jgi:glutamate 5-kinase
VLLTADDMIRRAHYRNAQRTLERLLGLDVLPVVNENDTVATDEIRVGDNDRLAALVAQLIGADALVLLSDIECLYTRPPDEPGAAPIPRVAYGDDLHGFQFGSVVVNSVGTGGAATKVSAARLAAASGIGVLVTSADLVAEALAGAEIGTWFQPNPEPAAPAATGPVRTAADRLVR